MSERERDEASGWRQPADEVSFLGLVNSVLRHRYLVVSFVVGFAALGALSALIGGRTFTSGFSFLPQGMDGGEGRLSALAGQFGLELPATGGLGESPAFYRELIVSRGVLTRIARADYATRGEGESRTAVPVLAGRLGIEPAEWPARLPDVLEWLREETIAVEVDPDAGLVEVEVRTPWPELSFGIANRLLRAVHDFNLEARQSQAAAEREFIQERLDEARDSLLVAEGRLESFLLANRQFNNSPELAFRHDRLERRVSRRQEIVTSLAQAFEEARIREVRNTPVITVVDPAEPPLRPEPRPLVVRAGVGAGLGLLAGVLLGAAVDMFRRETEEGSSEAREFARLWSGVRSDLGGSGGSDR